MSVRAAHALPAPSLPEPATPHEVARTTPASAVSPAPSAPSRGAELHVGRDARFRHWTASSFRELAAHLAELGVARAGPNALATLQKAELLRAECFEPRVRPADMKRAVARAEAAQRMTPAPQVDLFGFTRLIDAPFALDAGALELLAAAAGEATGRDAKAAQAELLGLIDRGPADGAIAFAAPKDALELVASLVRQVVLGKGAPLQLRVTPELARWLEGALAAGGRTVSEAMGGAGAFCANLASALPGVRAHFYSAEDLPERIERRFSGRVSVLSSKGEPRPVAERTSKAEAARVNYAAEYKVGALSLFGQATVRVNGEVRALVASDRGRVILGTPGTQRAVFGPDVGPEALARMGRDHDLFFAVGTHYHTSEPGAPDAHRLAEQIRAMMAANPRLLAHLQYVVPKVPEREHEMLQALRGVVGSMSLNAAEVPGLLGRMREHGMSSWPGDARAKADEGERMAALVSGAEHLFSGMALRRVHIHGRLGDLLIADGVRDPDRQVLALVRARQLASMKSENASGEIRAPSDLWPIAPVVDGKALAAVYAFADELQRRFPERIDAREHARIVERWWYREPESGRLFAFAPSRGIHDAPGGTISLGDTIDSTALIYGLDSDRARPLVHPKSFEGAKPTRRSRNSSRETKFV